MTKYSFRCQDIRDSRSGGHPFECRFAASAETKEELWKKVKTHWETDHFVDGKGALEDDPKLKSQIENAIKEN